MYIYSIIRFIFATVLHKYTNMSTKGNSMLFAVSYKQRLYVTRKSC